MSENPIHGYPDCGDGSIRVSRAWTGNSRPVPINKRLHSSSLTSRPGLSPIIHSLALLDRPKTLTGLPFPTRYPPFYSPSRPPPRPPDVRVSCSHPKPFPYQSHLPSSLDAVHSQPPNYSDYQPPTSRGSPRHVLLSQLPQQPGSPPPRPHYTTGESQSSLNQGVVPIPPGRFPTTHIPRRTPDDRLFEIQIAHPTPDAPHSHSPSHLTHLLQAPDSQSGVRDNPQHSRQASARPRSPTRKMTRWILGLRQAPSAREEAWGDQALAIHGRVRVRL